MPYTLLSSPVLAFELAHLPAGPTVAHVLLSVLTGDVELLAALGPWRPGDRAAPGPVPQAGLDIADLQLAGGDTSAEVMAALKKIRLGGPDDFELLIRRDILTACAGAGGIGVGTSAADAVTRCALHHWSLCDGPEERSPSTGTAMPPGSLLHRTEHDLGPHSAAVLDLLRSMAVPGAGSTWAQAQTGDRQAWTAAMHQATWAVHLSNRVVQAARAQLLGVLAFRDAGFGSGDVSSGAWNVLSGVLQGMVVSDLLDSASLDVLLAPVEGRSAPHGHPGPTRLGDDDRS